jgi:hypothetical protein
MATQYLEIQKAGAQYEKELNQRIQRASEFLCFYWYGHIVHLEPGSLIENQFYAILKRTNTLYGRRIKNVIENKSVIDVMYHIVTDDNYCQKSYCHQLYILTLAYTLFEEKRLYFSTSERKYTYMVKVSEISRRVIAEIDLRNKCDDTRDALINLAGCAITCLLGYILI